MAPESPPVSDPIAGVALEENPAVAWIFAECNRDLQGFQFEGPREHPRNYRVSRNELRDQSVQDMLLICSEQKLTETVRVFRERLAGVQRELVAYDVPLGTIRHLGRECWRQMWLLLRHRKLQPPRRPRPERELRDEIAMIEHAIGLCEAVNVSRERIPAGPEDAWQPEDPL